MVFNRNNLIFLQTDGCCWRNNSLKFGTIKCGMLIIKKKLHITNQYMILIIFDLLRMSHTLIIYHNLIYHNLNNLGLSTAKTTSEVNNSFCVNTKSKFVTQKKEN